MHDKFLNLFKKFVETLPKINQMLFDGKDNPFLRREIARFEREIIQPMDREWDLIPETQKTKLLTDEFLMKGIVL